MAKKKMTLEEKLEEAIVKDAPYEVPDNWINVKLNSIVKFEKGKKPKILIDDFEDKAIPYVTIKYFQTKEADQYTFETETNRLCKEDDILIVWDGARAGLIGTGVKGALGSTLCNIRFDDINKKFMYYYFLSKYDLINSNTKGTGIPHVDPSYLDTLVLSIPPLKEQQRIVDRIESLFEKLDKAKELIEEARDDFEKRKSAVLEKAFRGELTKEWRKESYINSNLMELLLNQNNKLKKNFTFSEATELFELPNQWNWIKLKDCCEKFKYGTSAKSKEEGKVPVLRMGNLQEGKLDWTNLVYTSDEEEIKKYELISGDLLFNRTNSPELVGKTSIYEGEREAIYAGYLIRVRTLEGIDSRFVNYFMNSIFAKHRCMEVKSDGVSQSNINAEKLGDFDIPLPPTEEQKEIVRILDKLLENESKIEELIALEKQIELIKKSILAKVFRGQLGTNSEDDESAIELLKEILNK